MGDRKKSVPAKGLLELDEPVVEDLAGEDERVPSTKRPDYDAAKFAKHVESAEQRMTSPPEPTYEMLRDSCKSKIAAELPLDEEQIVRPSSHKYKVAPPKR